MPNKLYNNNSIYITIICKYNFMMPQTRLRITSNHQKVLQLLINIVGNIDFYIFNTIREIWIDICSHNNNITITY